MPFTPTDKTPGDPLRSQDWNDHVHETLRLETAKVNRSGDTITGPLTINGALAVNDNVIVQGALSPSAGNSAQKGIMFPLDPGGGSGDTAYMRYYARTGEACTLEIGTTNDPDDHISLMPTGSVGIGTLAPTTKLTISTSGAPSQGVSHVQLRREATETVGGNLVFLELYQDQAVTLPVFPSIRFHHNGVFWHRVEARNEGLFFKTGDPASDVLSDIYAGTIHGVGATVRGMVVMWFGDIGQVPQGWALCDGGNGTPDLRNRFVVGAGASYGVGSTGGADQVTLSIAQMPSHSHYEGDFYAVLSPHRNGKSDTPGSLDDNPGAGREPNVTDWRQMNYQGGNEPHENRPPYYALAYIMKL